MRQLLEEARGTFDWVIVDTPPVVLFPDAELFAGKVDRCVLVVSAASTSPAVAARVVSTIGASRIVGTVLNRAAAAQIADGYGYGSYAYAQNEAPRRPAWWSRARSRS